MADSQRQSAGDYATLLAECERHRKANLLRTVLHGYDRQDEFINDAINTDDFDRVPWRITEKFQAENALLRTVVRRLLDGWIIGDNCDPGEQDEFAWERCRLAAPGSWVDEREPFEVGVADLLDALDGTPKNARGATAENEAPSPQSPQLP